MGLRSEQGSKDFTSQLLTVIKVLVAIGLVAAVHYELPEVYEELRLRESIRVIDGEVYGTCEPVQKLRNLNKIIRPTLGLIENSPYFRVFKVNMERDCPFWAQKRLCNSNKCSVCECEEKDVPLFWKDAIQQDQMSMGAHKHTLYGKQSMGMGAKKMKQEEWCQTVEDLQDKAEELPSFAAMAMKKQKKDLFEDELVYVNLPDNKESYTAYNGSQIWNAIYEENCMLDRVYRKGIKLHETCREETLLYQLISGLHASVNMHVSARYFDMETNQLFMNHTKYYDNLGQHPERVKNLHLLYAMSVRAVNKISEQLLQKNYSTGVCTQNDALTVLHVSQLLTQTLEMKCVGSFNESAFFATSDSFQRELQLAEMRDKFYNISRVFDCIGCDKCRFNGKVQITGLGAAMKILFQSQKYLDSKVGTLADIEIIGLLNLLAKVSESLEYYEAFLKLEDELNWNVRLKLHAISLAIILIVFLSKRALDIARAEKKPTRQIAQEYDNDHKVKED